MGKARLKRENLPIGSGEVEAANKTLVTTRLKRAGARWTISGGQAILTFRTLCKSGRFHRAWNLLSLVYKATIDVPHNVVPLRQGLSSV